MRWAAAVLVLLAAAGCGGNGGGAATEAGASTVVVTVPEATVSEATVTVPAEPEACDPAAILDAVQGPLGDAIERVEVVRCRDGYARASAIPAEANMETADVLLKQQGDAWTVVDFGTSIGCEESFLPPAPAANREACTALGYPQPAILGGATFRHAVGEHRLHLGARRPALRHPERP